MEFKCNERKWREKRINKAKRKRETQDGSLQENVRWSKKISIAENGSA